MDYCKVLLSEEPHSSVAQSRPALAVGSLLIAMLLCVVAAAQTTPTESPDVMQVLETKVRAIFGVPPQVKVIMSPLHPSDVSGYDALNVTFDDPQSKREFEFLLARDHRTLLRVFHIDMNKDPYAEIMKHIDL